MAERNVDTDVLNAPDRGLRGTYEGFQSIDDWSRPDSTTLADENVRDALDESAGG